MKDDIGECRAIVDKEIKRFTESLNIMHEPFLVQSYAMLKEYILRGGKRLRAISCIKAYEALSKKKENKIILPSISLEFFHSSSLVHDDIMDEDDLRRNMPSMHKLFQNDFLKRYKETDYRGKIFGKQSVRFSTSSAIILGNILFSLGLKCITSCDFDELAKNEALDMIQEAYREVNDGQLLDMINEFETDIDEKEYLEMVALKTGKLFATSMKLGAIFANASKENKILMGLFGMNIAIAFQIQDDIMDISEDMKKGNTLGSDIMKGKRTILMINALKNATNHQKVYLEQILGKPNASEQEIKKVISIFEDSGAIKKAKELAASYVKKGKENLKKLKKDITKEGYMFFDHLADYMTDRVV